MRMQKPRSRRGVIVPLAALCLVGLLAFVALALDLGLLMIARNQCQNAADAAAMAGARTLTGDTSTNNNYANVQPNARTAAAANRILNQPINAASQLSVTVGDYYYDSASASFKINPSGRQAGDNWNLVQATVTSQQPSYFARVLGVANLNASATATAAHRPRDAAITIDFSGSMRFESLLAEPPNGARTASMNPDTVYPTFGHYSGNSSYLTYSADKQALQGETISAANTAVATTNALTPVVNGFYGDTAAFGTTTPAFTAASSSYASTPGGDAPLKVGKGAGPGYAYSVSDFLYGSSSTQTTRDWRFELDGYSAYSGGNTNTNTSTDTDYASVPFNGYTRGPGYWGKTFMTWPPDPRVPVTATAPLGCTSGAYTSTQVQNLVAQFMIDLQIADGVKNSQALANMNGNKPDYTLVYQQWPGAGSTTPWTATTLSAYLTNTGNGNKNTGLGLSNTSNQYVGLMRLFNRSGGAGMPTDGSGNPAPCDWRARFFKTPSGAPLLDDSKLWATSGAWQAPSSGTYLINYDAILDWIKNCGTNPFPNQLRAGGIVYYTAIPSTIDTSTFPPADPNQRFWKEYIDEVLGVQQSGGSGSAPSYGPVGQFAGYGADFSWGTPATSAPTGWPALSLVAGKGASLNNYPNSGTSTSPTYLTYTDNPQRPKLRGWFGPLSLIDFLGNYNGQDSTTTGSRLWWPGTVAEAPMYQAKLAVQAALKDVLQNHPNDNVALVFFSGPKSSATGVGALGYYNYTRAPLGRDQRAMINALWFSPKVIQTNAEISVYNSSGQNPGDIYDVPRANGSTCYAMPLMLAYNQFSANSALVNYTAHAPAGTAGGLGRNGAAKLVVFETDGVVSQGASANLISSSDGKGYYQVRIADANNLSAGGTEFPTTSATFANGSTASQTIAQQICNDVSAGGFSTSSKPVRIHCIAFGSLFEPSNTTTQKTNALQNLATLEMIGKVQPSGATTLASNKIITGDYNTRMTNLQAAFNAIMQDGVQVTLLSSGAGKP